MELTFGDTRSCLHSLDATARISQSLESLAFLMSCLRASADPIGPTKLVVTVPVSAHSMSLYEVGLSLYGPCHCLPPVCNSCFLCWSYTERKTLKTKLQAQACIQCIAALFASNMLHFFLVATDSAKCLCGCSVYCCIRQSKRNGKLAEKPRELRKDNNIDVEVRRAVFRHLGRLDMFSSCGQAFKVAQWLWLSWLFHCARRARRATFQPQGSTKTCRRECASCCRQGTMSAHIELQDIGVSRRSGLDQRCLQPCFQVLWSLGGKMRRPAVVGTLCVFVRVASVGQRPRHIQRLFPHNVRSLIALHDKP